MNKNYKDITSFEAACKTENLDAAMLIETWSNLGLTKDEIAYKKLKVFAKAINGDWTPKMGNADEWKYYPWFRVNAAGFSYSNYVLVNSNTSVGSRLCFETSEQALHAAKFGEQMYIEFLL